MRRPLGQAEYRLPSAEDPSCLPWLLIPSLSSHTNCLSVYPGQTERSGRAALSTIQCDPMARTQPALRPIGSSLAQDPGCSVPARQMAEMPHVPLGIKPYDQRRWRLDSDRQMSASSVIVSSVSTDRARPYDSRRLPEPQVPGTKGSEHEPSRHREGNKGQFGPH